MDEVLHLDVQQQRLVRILDIERVETAAFGDDRHVRLVTEIPDHRLYADNILRTVGLSRHKIRGTEVHIADGGGENDVRGRLDSGIDAIEWAKQAEALGAGEILLTSMDCDGTKAGYDIPLTRAVSDAVSIPVIASGGAGTLEHFYEGLTDGGADAVLAASLFHYKELEISQVKDYLAEKGVPVRR